MQLKDIEGTKQLATVLLPAGRTLTAEFVLQGTETYVGLYLNSESDNDLYNVDHLPAILTDGTKISFVQAQPAKRQIWRHVGGTTSCIHLRPEFVIVGQMHVNKASTLKVLSVFVDDATKIFYDFDAFSFVLRPEQHLETITKSDAGITGRAIPCGNHPVIGYFTGKDLVFSADTLPGNISAFHRPLHSMASPAGFRVENHIYTDIRLMPPTSLSMAIDHLLVLLRFLELIAGRRQNILSLLASVDEGPPFEIYLCSRPKRPVDRRELYPDDLPLNGGIDPDRFGRVLTKWIEMDSSRRDARMRFSSGFSKQGRYDIDRLVGAANMFDILPADAVPKKTKLTPDLSNAQKEANQLFKTLPQSPERDSILGALGRLGDNSLKQKVQHRAKILLAVASDCFPELMFVTDQAIDCRNHYVHGSKTKINYAAHFSTVVPFLTNTLEFVFAASEFVEAGWDFSSWADKGSTGSHPWGSYLDTYEGQLSNLRKHLTSSKP